jgi:hypothetical protein
VEVITAEDHLYRRLIYGSVKSGKTLRSAYYRRGNLPDPELSVNLARMSTPEQTAQSGPWPGFGVGVLPVAIPIEMDLTVQHAPETNNDAHCLIIGVQTRAQCRLLAEATEVLIHPEPKPSQ